MKKQPLGTSAVAYGRKYLGVPYVWGGTTPSGFDCSGYAQYVYRQMGINLPRTSYQQWDYLRNRGKSIAAKQLQPGDLVFFGKGKVSHVMMYAGGGMLIGASGGKKMGGSVKIKPLGYRGDVVGYAAVTRNVGGIMPSADLALMTESTRDPNARGTDKMLQAYLKRQAREAKINALTNQMIGSGRQAQAEILPKMAGNEFDPLKQADFLEVEKQGVI